MAPGLHTLKRACCSTQIGLVIGNGWAARSKQRQREAEAAGRGSPPWYRCDAEFGKQVRILREFQHFSVLFPAVLPRRLLHGFTLVVQCAGAGVDAAAADVRLLRRRLPTVSRLLLRIFRSQADCVL